MILGEARSLGNVATLKLNGHGFPVKRTVECTVGGVESPWKIVQVSSREAAGRERHVDAMQF